MPWNSQGACWVADVFFASDWYQLPQPAATERPQTLARPSAGTRLCLGARLARILRLPPRPSFVQSPAARSSIAASTRTPNAKVCQLNCEVRVVFDRWSRRVAVDPSSELGSALSVLPAPDVTNEYLCIGWRSRRLTMLARIGSLTCTLLVRWRISLISNCARNGRSARLVVRGTSHLFDPQQYWQFCKSFVSISSRVDLLSGETPERCVTCLQRTAQAVGRSLLHWIRTHLCCSVIVSFSESADISQQTCQLPFGPPLCIFNTQHKAQETRNAKLAAWPRAFHDPTEGCSRQTRNPRCALAR